MGRRVKFHPLRSFVAVYEEGSFSAGAQRVHATQSGLSMPVRELEQRYGVTLFARSAAGVSPTDAGRRFYAQAVRVLRAVAEAEDALRGFKGKVAGAVEIGLTPTFTRSVPPAMLRRAAEILPLVTITVHEGYSAHLSELAARGRLDFAVAPALEETPALRSEPIGTDREYLVAAPGPDMSDRAPVRLADLGMLQRVLPGRANARRRRIETCCVENRVRVAEVLELDAMLGALELVARSDWMTILPGILCAADAGGAVRVVRPVVELALRVLLFPASDEDAFRQAAQPVQGRPGHAGRRGDAGLRARPPRDPSRSRLGGRPAAGLPRDDGPVPPPRLRRPRLG
jgi:DNA-binding transcriptional LysR family regulator